VPRSEQVWVQGQVSRQTWRRGALPPRFQQSGPCFHRIAFSLCNGESAQLDRVWVSHAVLSLVPCFSEAISLSGALPLLYCGFALGVPFCHHLIRKVVLVGKLTAEVHAFAQRQGDTS
jgi:hypothetical protein